MVQWQVEYIFSAIPIMHTPHDRRRQAISCSCIDLGVALHAGSQVVKSNQFIDVNWAIEQTTVDMLCTYRGGDIITNWSSMEPRYSRTQIEWPLKTNSVSNCCTFYKFNLILAHLLNNELDDSRTRFNYSSLRIIKESLICLWKLNLKAFFVTLSADKEQRGLSLFNSDRSCIIFS